MDRPLIQYKKGPTALYLAGSSTDGPFRPITDVGKLHTSPLPQLAHVLFLPLKAITL
jgi:hypothetical protein